MDKETKELLDHVINNDGMELHRDDWPLAEKLVEMGKLHLTGARGPNKDWKRAIYIEPEMVPMAFVLWHSGLTKEKIYKFIERWKFERPDEQY